MGETQHCVLKVIFLKCSYFCKNSWRKVSCGFLLWQNFFGKYQNLKLKVYSWTNVCVELTWTYVCDMMETCIDIDVCDILLNIKKSIMLKFYMYISIYDYACRSLYPECCQSLSLLLTLLGFRVLAQGIYYSYNKKCFKIPGMEERDSE